MRWRGSCADVYLVKTVRVFSKLWLPAVVLVVIAIVSYGVNAVRHMSEAITNPPAKSSIPATVVQINPKNVTYEVFGTLRSGGEVRSPRVEGLPNLDHPVASSSSLFPMPLGPPHVAVIR